jgi:hypothetical protein
LRPSLPPLRYIGNGRRKVTTVRTAQARQYPSVIEDPSGRAIQYLEWPFFAEAG